MSQKTLLVTFAFLAMAFVALGQKKVGDTARGKASYYHSKFNGKKTASGEVYYASKMTCAHRTLPYGTLLKVTNLRNKQSVVVRVNDRGPFAKGRIVDLSYKAASKIDMINEGVADVRIEIVDSAKEDKKPIAKNDPKKPEPKKPSKKEEKKEDDALVVAKKVDKTLKDTKGIIGTAKSIFGGNKKKNKRKEKEKASSKTTTTASKPAKKDTKPTPTSTKTATTTKSSGSFASGGTYSVWGTKMSPQGFGIQIASYTELADAIKVGKEAHSLGLQPIFIQAGWANNKKVYRIIFGSYANAAEAGKDLRKAKAKGFNGSFVKKHL